MTLAARWFDLEQHLTNGTYPNLIGGSWRSSLGGDGEAQWNPSSGAETGWLRYASIADVNEAVRTTQVAQRAWAASGPRDRLEWLTRLRDALQSNNDAFVNAVAVETGKTITDAAVELRLAEDLLSWLADGDLWRSRARGRGSRLAPHGVLAGISLYHYPVLSPLSMLAPAIAAGNGFVLRPCTWSPATAVMLGKLVQSAGVPDGVLNLVQGAIEVVDRLLDHPDVAGISYVGSGPWALYMYRKASQHGKRVQAMGALRQVHIVLRMANLDVAADAIVDSVVRLAGQRWLAGTSVLVDPSVADALVERLAERASRVIIGPPQDAGTQLGPVVRRERRSDLEARVEEAVSTADVVVDGRVPASEQGFFVGPSIIDLVTAKSRLWRDEVPGPLISVLRLDPERMFEVLSASPHGLVGSVYGEMAADIASRLPLSMLAIDSALPELPAGVPWAAWPPGFFGTDHWNGPEQLDFVTRVQVLHSPNGGDGGAGRW